MKHIDFEFNGKIYALSFTAEALFTVYDEFGVTDHILEATHCLEPTTEGWKNLCWLAALMAMQGELQRRHMGLDARPMITMEELRTGFMAADSTYLMSSVRAALEQGFKREVSTEREATEKEINLVLQAREDTAKKMKLLARSALDTLRQQLTTFISASKRPSS